jgi:hypothetical protein
MDRLLRLKKSLGYESLDIELKPLRSGPTLKEMLAQLDRREPGKPLRKGGRCTFLYIPDLDTNEGTQKDANPEHLNKVHLTYCDILQNMENAGRDDRYEATDDTSGEFNCIYNDDTVTKKRLHVCKYCMDAIDNRTQYGSYKQFDFKKFSEDHSYEGMATELIVSSPLSV